MTTQLTDTLEYTPDAVAASTPASTKRADDRVPHLVIRPPTGWSPLNLHELWAYREMIYRMVLRNVKASYKQTALGPFWVIVIPLLQAGLFSVIFGALAGLSAGQGSSGEQIPYPVFVYAGMLIWNMFSRSFTATANCLHTQAGILTKVYYPRLIAPLTGIAGGMLDIVLGGVILTILLFATGTAPTLAILTIPLFLLLCWMTALAAGLWIAALSVRFRDLGRAGTFITTFLMWLTPVAWSSQLVFNAERLSPAWQPWVEAAFQLNPLYHVVEGFRWAAIGYTEWQFSIYTVISLTATLAVFITGLFFFRRVDANVADYI